VGGLADGAFDAGAERVVAVPVAGLLLVAGVADGFGEFFGVEAELAAVTARAGALFLVGAGDAVEGGEGDDGLGDAVLDVGVPGGAGLPGRADGFPVFPVDGEVVGGEALLGSGLAGGVEQDRVTRAMP
jgi:hypothetical protein